MLSEDQEPLPLEPRPGNLWATLAEALVPRTARHPHRPARQDPPVTFLVGPIQGLGRRARYDFLPLSFA